MTPDEKLRQIEERIAILAQTVPVVDGKFTIILGYGPDRVVKTKPSIQETIQTDITATVEQFLAKCNETLSSSRFWKTPVTVQSFSLRADDLPKPISAVPLLLERNGKYCFCSTGFIHPVHGAYD